MKKIRDSSGELTVILKDRGECPLSDGRPVTLRAPRTFGGSEEESTPYCRASLADVRI